ncbi:MAG: phasin family protein [Sphingomonadaceae bacterium]
MSKKTTFAPKMTVAEVQKKAAEVAADVQSKSKEVAAEVQKYSKEAYAKGSKLVSEGTAITKANAEAVVASGKIVAAGVKDMTEKNVAVSRKAVGTFGDDLKAFADVKSPSALLEMQGKLAARNYDAMVDYMSKTSTLFGDVAKAAFAPLSARTKATYETISKAA